MTWILLSQYVQGFLELVPLDLTMGSQVTTCRAVVDKVMLSKEALSTGVISSREVNLGKEKGILCITWA